MSLEDPVNIAHEANRDFLLGCVLREVSLDCVFVVSCARLEPPLTSTAVEKDALNLALQRAEEYMWKLRIAHQEFDS